MRFVDDDREAAVTQALLAENSLLRIRESLQGADDNWHSIEHGLSQLLALGQV
ncbi:hypothetical protein D3C77_348470 [compost metagenome]